MLAGSTRPVSARRPMRASDSGRGSVRQQRNGRPILLPERCSSANGTGPEMGGSADVGAKRPCPSNRLEPLVVLDQGVAKNVLEREQFEVTLLGE